MKAQTSNICLKFIEKHSLLRGRGVKCSADFKELFKQHIFKRPMLSVMHNNHIEASYAQ